MWRWVGSGGGIWVPLRRSLSLSLSNALSLSFSPSQTLSLSLSFSDVAVGWVRRFDLLVLFFFSFVFWLFSVLVIFWGVILFGDFGCGRNEMVVEHFFSIEIFVFVMAGR
jgi:hypothetical protein